MKWMSIIAVMCCIIFVVIVSFVYEERQTIDTEFKIAGNFGINADGDALRFGKLMPLTVGERKIVVENNRDYPIVVTYSVSGEVKDHISAKPAKLLLEPHQEQNMTFLARAPDWEFGNYSGQVQLIFRKKLPLLDS